MTNVLAIFVLSIFVIAISAGAPLAGSRPNIVLVMTDDQGYAPVGEHGHPWIVTPNMDRMHAEGTRFERFLVSPTCSPTRSSLMSGRHPLKNGITHTILERERMALSTVTIAQVLKGAGYSTGIFGKWHLGDEEPNGHQWGGFGVRNQRYRLVGDQLFDMEKDPGQKSDIAATNPEIVKEMRAAYDAFWK
jgi:arylsulfatase A-like enzyme